MSADVPYGLNLFAPPGHGTGAAAVSSYADSLREEAQEHGVDLSPPRWDDDQYSEKLDLICEQRSDSLEGVWVPCPARWKRRLANPRE
jgi:hypothetical protein